MVQFSEYLSRKKNETSKVDSLKNKRISDTKSPNVGQVNDIEKQSMVSPTKYQSPSWDHLDSFINYYELPPILSPNLPSKYNVENKAVNGDLNNIPKKVEPSLPDAFQKNVHQSAKIPKMLSPTLPDRYERKLVQPQPQRNLKIHHLEDQLNTTVVPKNKDNIYQQEVKQDRPGEYSAKKRSVSEDESPKPIGLGISTKASKKIKKDQRPATASTAIASKATVKTYTQTATTLEELLKKVDKYLEVAKYRKHRGDDLKPKNPRLALAYFIDCIIIYLVTFNHDDQARRLSRKLYNDNRWLSLIDFLNFVLNFAKSNDIEDIVGLVYQVRSIVYEHLSSIYEDFIKIKQSRRNKLNTNDFDDIIKIDDAIITDIDRKCKYAQLSKKGIMEAEKYLSIFKIQEKYPSIIQAMNAATNIPDNESKLIDPVNDNLHLPISTGVGLKEITRYAFLFVKAWCKEQDIGYEDWIF
ncbi:hypothetical protein WICMUC_002986 [Wickerhamomyces mucosus]|uniref:Uncharacterized protein n=1 Tax=Wickerhamomyces mucosus TaxID=1378264 RepID=A0A9P8PME1_9ASCO|nr:hypothetical protein WICMUC_002986 [Wickerhamomyces mucosus]